VIIFSCSTGWRKTKVEHSIFNLYNMCNGHMQIVGVTLVTANQDSIPK